MSSAQTRLPFRPSGTSPATMRCARPSTIAVLPTPGSPISTGLFFVRRESTWITRRISSSRPITGSSLPASASAGQVAAELLERLVGALGILRRDALAAAHLLELRRAAASRGTTSSASSRCSAETYSSSSACASSKALVEHLARTPPTRCGCCCAPSTDGFCASARLGLGAQLGLAPARRAASAAAPGRAARAAGARGRAPGCRRGARAPARRRPPPGS